ncbi:MAG: hypothetical protein VX949_06735 [Planctomycetota bacterium]|nr:hypothetical protein [Planctomycetota bacterium]
MNWTEPQILTSALLVAAAIQWIPAASDALRRNGVLKRCVSIRSRIRKD